MGKGLGKFNGEWLGLLLIPEKHEEKPLPERAAHPRAALQPSNAQLVPHSHTVPNSPSEEGRETTAAGLRSLGSVPELPAGIPRAL